MVITYGRSGSTLLQTAMNGLDNVCIRGENYLAAAPLYESWRRIIAAQNDHGEKYSMPGQPWYGASQLDSEQFGKDLVAAFIRNVLRPEPHTEWIGFKEIRYNNMGNNFEGFIDFAFKYFPNLRVIFNLRDWDSVCSSGWFSKQDPKDVRSMLSKMEERFARSAARYPGQSMTVRYEEMIANPGEYKNVADFLNVPFDAHRIATILEKKLTH
ncbi:sulfotransferase [Albirhodobacter sp. R86504]|uniref:sulfotransferase n=1 Tax=Albirhodobacter sp. R86504 TaxID=3093848 RepID=UPI00366AF059